MYKKRCKDIARIATYKSDLECFTFQMKSITSV
jgi:hypothetical protein